MNDLFAGDGPLVAAHRGFAVDAPENTLAAFAAAMKAGADLLEIDVHGSRDNVAMVTHDPGLRRVAGRPGLVADMASSALRRVDLGGHSMPTLEETLDVFPHERFSIDVKDERAVEPTVSAIERTGAQNRVLIASFSEKRRHEVVSRLGQVKTIGTHRHAVAAWSIIPLLQRTLAQIDALFLPTKAYGVSMFSPRMVATATAHNVTLGAWTINDPVEMEALWRAGVQVIVTDRTDLAVERRTLLADEPTSRSRD
jgi:glycerophosphoryl diester phosphodiesterase